MVRPLLLTPGPLTVSDRVRAALNRDWGARDTDFIAMTGRVRHELLAIAQTTAEDAVAIPLQGPGTQAVEAMMASFAPRDTPTIVAINGAYGHRMVDMLRRLGRPCIAVEGPETRALDPDQIMQALDEHPQAATLAVVQCETTTGCLNPMDAIADLARLRGLTLLVDAMSAFGALPTRMQARGIVAVAASSNKCLQGVPGLGLVIARHEALQKAVNPLPLSLDLAGQAGGFAAAGEWRFTPPTHVVAALAEAMDELRDEGGPEARLSRYTKNAACLINGMAELGFEPVLSSADQAPIIVTFALPEARPFDFKAFYDALKTRGFVIYPGKLTAQDSFRIGCIGNITPDDIARFLDTFRSVMEAG